MDMFMDKLAQRFNAQEIIKANTTAEAKELDELRGKAGEYRECLEELRKLLQESADREIARVADDEKLARLEEKLGEISLRLDGLGEKVDAVESRLAVSEEAEEETDLVQNRLTEVEEHVHKECVKVYRNVQAVVVEESGKAMEAVTRSAETTQKLSGKSTATLIIAVLALLSSAGAVIFQLLQMMNFKLF